MPPGNVGDLTIAWSGESGVIVSGDQVPFDGPGSVTRGAPGGRRDGIAAMTRLHQFRPGHSYEGRITASYERVIRIEITGAGGA